MQMGRWGEQGRCRVLKIASSLEPKQPRNASECQQSLSQSEAACMLAVSPTSNRPGDTLRQACVGKNEMNRALGHLCAHIG